MKSSFFAAVDSALAQALPHGWARVPQARLPGRGRTRVRHCFRMRTGEGASSYLAIVAVGRIDLEDPADNGGRSAPHQSVEGAADGAGLPAAGAAIADGQEKAAAGDGRSWTPSGTRPASAARVGRELAALVEHILAQGARLLLLHEQESHLRLDELGGFIQRLVERPEPRLLVLPCARGAAGSWTVAPTAAGQEELAATIRDLWSGELSYSGPRAGEQRVGVEIMRDSCCRCGTQVETVTGIVFPDSLDSPELPPPALSRETSAPAAVAAGSADLGAPGHTIAPAEPVPPAPPAPSSEPGAAPDLDRPRGKWPYFHRLLPLAQLPDPLARALAAAVDRWRNDGDSSLTVIRLCSPNRHRPRPGRSSWTAICPACGALRGACALNDERRQLLHDRNAPMNGDLRYRSLALDITVETLRRLVADFEIHPSTRAVGWFRTPPAGIESPPREASPIALRTPLEEERHDGEGGSAPASSAPARFGRPDGNAAAGRPPAPGRFSRLWIKLRRKTHGAPGPAHDSGAGTS
ncbi:MAG TPA: hypothetical protein VHR45_01950 [Thermoanaerobaculia bacterium]|nr:hypothetical protein [Thermoanaerobaculia bacterium]